MPLCSETSKYTSESTDENFIIEHDTTDVKLKNDEDDKKVFVPASPQSFDEEDQSERIRSAFEKTYLFIDASLENK